MVKSGGRLFFLRADEIDWIEAAGNYVRLHVGSQSHLLRETMNAIEGTARSGALLSDPPLADRERRAHPGDAALAERRYSIVLRSGIRLTLSRGYRERLQDRLKI